MRRTAHRPLPHGDVKPEGALVFGLVLEALAFALLWSTVNLLSAVLAVSAMLFYVFVYTIWLKPRSPQNIVIGGAAGAVPVLVGWAAVTGELAAPAWVLFAIVFFWTPPHFWALSLRYFDDYQAAGHPDAAGGQGHARRGPPDRRVLDRRGGDDVHAPPRHRRRRRGLPRGGRGARRAVHRARRSDWRATPRRRRPYGCSRSRTPTSRSSSPPLPSTPSSAPSEPAAARAGPAGCSRRSRSRWWSWSAPSPGSRSASNDDDVRPDGRAGGGTQRRPEGRRPGPRLHRCRRSTARRCDCPTTAARRSS